jgi:CheY-like chemotaxis protein
MKEQTILLVDDSENDLFLMRRALKRAEFNVPVQEAHNGEIAISYLAGKGIYGNRNEYPSPALVLLDLNMPMKNGFDVLEWVRTQPSLRRLTIIVMTASLRPEDVDRAFELKAASYLVKPANMESLTSMARSIRDWTQINHFPPRNEMVVK